LLGPSLGRVGPTGARFLTFSCYRRLKLFGNPLIGDGFARPIFACRARTGFKLQAWVIMPEHIFVDRRQGVRRGGWTGRGKANVRMEVCTGVAVKPTREARAESRCRRGVRHGPLRAADRGTFLRSWVVPPAGISLDDW